LSDRKTLKTLKTSKTKQHRGVVSVNDFRFGFSVVIFLDLKKEEKNSAGRKIREMKNYSEAIGDCQNNTYDNKIPFQPKSRQGKMPQKPVERFFLFSKSLSLP